PGEFFSVQPLYTRNIPELLARNERVVCLFDTALGKMAVVFVGAMIVRSITTAWAGIVAPRESRDVYSVDYGQKNITYAKGEEIGKFTMGSTVICLFEKGKINFENLILENHINMGEAVAKCKK
ncbi:MAG: phosphatidylserine decarboxylase, partial [Alphaproteobacteria bacterium]|nr:phosphatidylserine decarboxylase [Alphaproteobacteria bacterium]